MNASQSEMKCFVSFRTASFNPTEAVISARGSELPFGGDLCLWLIAELRKRGIETSETPDDSDWAWSFDFTVANAAHTFVVSLDEQDDVASRWTGYVDRAAAFSCAPDSRSRTGISPKAIRAIDAILSDSPSISEIEWTESA